MKLYLSSYRVPDVEALESLLDKPLGECSVALITHAQDNRLVDEKKSKVLDTMTYWSDMSGSVEIVDLKEFNVKDDLKRALLKYDLIAVMGGNTYQLIAVMSATGFDEVIASVLEMGVVYHGESAGAIAAGPTLEYFNDFEVACGNKLTADELVMKGLCFVDEVIIPHEDSYDEKYNGRGSEMKKAFPDDNILPLGDKQALIVDGSHKRIIGKMQPSAQED